MSRQVARQLGLGAGRADDQDRPGSGQRVRHAAEELLVGRRVAAADRVGLVVKVHVPVMRADDGAVDLIGIEMEDLRLVMIDPDDGVEVRAASPPPRP